jgi:hypothetical protein
MRTLPLCPNHIHFLLDLSLRGTAKSKVGRACYSAEITRIQAFLVATASLDWLQEYEVWVVQLNAD